MKTVPARPETMVNYITVPASIAGQVYEAPASVPDMNFTNAIGGGPAFISTPAIIFEPVVIHTDSQEA